MSYIPGLQALVDKVPELATPRGFLRALLTAAIVFVVALAILLVADGMAPWLGFLVQLLVYGALYWLLRGFFGGRDARMTYADAFFTRFMPGAGLNLASLLFILWNGGGIGDASTVGRFFPAILAALVVIYLLASAAIIAVRAVQTAGVDTLAGLYVYYPDEGDRLRSGLYEVVRHPVYAALDRVALAFGIWSGSVYALLLAVIYVAVWHPIWIKVEESELAARWGDDYVDYAKRVPAVWPQGMSGEATLWQALTSRASQVVAGEPPSALTDEETTRSRERDEAE